MGMIKAGFIGCGNMGGVLAAVAAKSLGLAPGQPAQGCEGNTQGGQTGAAGSQNAAGSKGEVFVADHNQFKVDQLVETFGCRASSAAEIAAECDYIFLGVKPQVMDKACAEIKDILAARLKTAGCAASGNAGGAESNAAGKGRFCVISMAAGLTTGAYEKMLGKVPFIRIMPNTPCATGAGVILYSPGKLATQEDEMAFMQLMRPAGIISRLDESKIDPGCAVTGCGPAYVYMFIDALIDGGVRIGLPREQAKRFAIQTVLGSAMMCAQSGAAEPAKLKSDVCSPGGSTIEGVTALEDYAFRAAIMEAVKAAYERNKELGA